MTFIVRKPAIDGRTQYDIVEKAGTAQISPTGHLLLTTGTTGNRVVAVYAPGEWLTTFEDGGIKQATSTKVFEPLSAESFANGGPKD